MAYRSKKEILSHHPLFDSLGWWQTRTLAQDVDLVNIEAGEIVVAEGDKAEAIYIVVSGRLEGTRRLKSNRDHRERILLNGDTFGESALLSDRPYSFSVRALNDSLLLQVKSTTFLELMEKNPELSREVSERLASRMQKGESEDPKLSELIVVGSAQSRIGKSHFGVNFCGALAEETEEPVCLVDLTRSPTGHSVEDFPGAGDQAREWFDQRSQQHSVGFRMLPVDPGQSLDRFSALVSHLLAEFNFLMLVMPEGLDRALITHYQQADTLYIMTETSETALYQTRMLLNQLEEGNGKLDELELIAARFNQDRSRLQEIEERLEHSVLHSLPEIPRMNSDRDLLGQPYVSRHGHRPYSRTVRRLARKVGQVSVGLVLGVGAARGLSHIGVLRVLEEEEILVDVIAGASIGSLIGAAWSLGQSSYKMEEHARRLEGATGLMKLMDLNWPRKGLFRGTGAGEFMKSILGDATFSDTEIPLRIVATELNELNEVIFRQGSLLNAVRASAALPFVYAPVQVNGSTYVDGGVLSPVPISALSREGVSRIIAVNPIPHLELLKEHQRDQAVMQQETWLEAIKTGITPFGRGNLVDTFMKSLQTMQAQLAATEGSEADVLIEPALPALEWYEFNNPSEFIEQGVRAARNQLGEIKEVVQPGRS